MATLHSPRPRTALARFPKNRLVRFELGLGCESPVANRSCARGCLQVKVLCIKWIRKSVGFRGVAFEGFKGRVEEACRIHQAARVVAQGGLGELVKVEKLVQGLVIKGRVRLKRERKASIAWRGGEGQVGAELD